MVLGFLALYLTKEKGFTAAQAGAVLSTYGLGAIGGSLLGGWLSDRLAPRNVMAGSLILTGIGFFVLGSADSAATITAFVFVLSVCAESFRPANAAAISEASPPEARVQALGLSRLAMNLGLTFGPAAGGVLAAHSWTWLFIVDGGTCILAAALLLAALGPDRTHRSIVTSPSDGPARSPWTDGPYLVLLLLMLTLSSVLFQFLSTWTLYLHTRYGLSEAAIGSLVSVNTLIIVVAQMPLLRKVSKRDPLKVAGAGAFLFCLGYALLPFGESYGYAVLTVFVWTMGEMLSMPLIEGAAANRADDRSRGKYMGLLMLSFSSAFIIAPAVGTRIYQSFGPETLWYGCGLVGIVLLAAFRALSGPMGRNHTSTA